MLILLPSRIAFEIVELKKWKLTESKGQPHKKSNKKIIGTRATGSKKKQDQMSPKVTEKVEQNLGIKEEETSELPQKDCIPQVEIIHISNNNNPDEKPRKGDNSGCKLQWSDLWEGNWIIILYFSNNLAKQKKALAKAIALTKFVHISLVSYKLVKKVLIQKTFLLRWVKCIFF